MRLAFNTLLCAGLANGMYLRNLPEKPAARMKHLVQDIEESVGKAGEDAEMVFATLFTYDGQLDTSLTHEIGTLNSTLTSLLKMQSTYKADLSSSASTLSHLGATALDSGRMASKYEAGTAKTQSKFESLQQNVQLLIALLKNAKVTVGGALLTPEAPDANGEPARVYTAIRRLLIVNDKALRKFHPDVFAAFLPAKKQSKVTMTQGLLQHTIAALSGVKEHLKSMESQALLQFRALHQRFEEDAVSAGANAQAQQGVEAENEQKAGELSFSIKFTSSVLKADRQFSENVKAHLKKNTELISNIRDRRQAQLKLLHDLTGIFSTGEGAIPTAGLSFFEAGSETVSESVVENTIKNNGDTHALLMRIKASLDNAEPINTHSVRETMTEMEGVLSSVEEDQSKHEEAKRGCESQKFHAKETEAGLKANLALMSAAHDHAQRAIKAAHTNVQGIEKKVRSLETSSVDFARISSQAIKSLEAQSKDRQTILMAVQKAKAVVAPAGPSLLELYTSSPVANTRLHQRTSIVQLMQTLIDDIEAQDLKETAYRKQQDLFQSQFLNYVQDYTHMLEERRSHYQSSLGVLELHVSELSNDLLAQQTTLGTGRELNEQSQGLCESVMRFYDKHTKTRADLSVALRSILPSMPSVFSERV